MRGGRERVPGSDSQNATVESLANHFGMIGVIRNDRNDRLRNDRITCESIVANGRISCGSTLAGGNLTEKQTDQIFSN